MKSLYVRIVLTYIFISILSSLIALMLSNFYFQSQLKGESREKAYAVAKEIRTLYEQYPAFDFSAYLTHIGNMGFQIYAVDSQDAGVFYGGAFKHKEIPFERIEQVRSGKIYNGILAERRLLVLSYFNNSIENSIGIPVDVRGERYALFIRPNLEQQIGEVRQFLAVLLALIFISSTVLIVVLSRFIVKPVKDLTSATRQIVAGRFDVELNTARRDELGNLASHFTTMAHSIKRLDAMRQEFVANVSHEIQSPLTSIQGFAQTILDKGATPEEAKRYLQIIAEESTRLSSLSKQLLTLAAFDKEETMLKKSSYRLDEQIRHILIVTEWQWSEKGLDIDPELPDTIITADEQLLHQVWFNLITNSIKFSRPGGKISIEVQAEEHIVVIISDTGIGISEEELPHIFERFYKADKSRGSARSGSGLGLSIVQKIVELHEGIVEVKSTKGKGTAFTVRLPKR